MEALLSKLLTTHSYWSRFIPSFYYPYSVKGGRIYLDISESSMMFARVIGQYEVEKQKALQTFLSRGGSFIDIGANKGDFTILAAQLVGNEGNVLSFEPEPSNFKWLLKTIKINHYENIEAYQIALSDREGKEKLHIGKKSGFHSLLPQDSNRPETIGVQVLTLDRFLEDTDWNRSVDVIKIDVEGAEMNVLNGARRTLDQNENATLLIDIHPNKVDPSEVCSFLRDLGFSLFREQQPFTTPIDEGQSIPHSVVARRV